MMLVQMAVIFLRLQRQRKEDKTTADGSESSSSSEKNNESTSSTKESIIDGETDFEYETDEDGKCDRSSGRLYTTNQ